MRRYQQQHQQEQEEEQQERTVCSMLAVLQPIALRVMRTPRCRHPPRFTSLQRPLIGS